MENKIMVTSNMFWSKIVPIVYGWNTITYDQACVLETSFCVSDHIMGFSLP